MLEVKETIGSVLSAYADFSARGLMSNGARVVHGYRQQQVGGDPLYGYVNFGRSCLVRELSPADLGLDFDALSEKQLCAAARTCGEVLAGAHARTNDDTADDIRDSIANRARFARDVVRFAGKAADKMEQSYRVLLDMRRENAFVS